MTLQSKPLFIAATAVVLSAAGLARAQTTVPASRRATHTTTRPDNHGKQETKSALAFPGSGTLPVTLKRGLVLHYSFDEKEEGKAADTSGKANHGNLHGTKRTAGGKVGGAREFNGKSDYIHRGYDKTSPLFPKDTPFSVVAWFRTSAASPIHQTIVATHYAGSGSDGYMLALNIRSYGGKLRWGPLIKGGTIFSRRAVNDGKWHHAAGVWDGKRSSLYIDGVLQETSKTSGTLRYSHRASFRVGHMQNNNAPHSRDGFYYFHGTIDEVGIWNRALSAGEVRALFEGLLAGLPHITRAASRDRVELIDRSVLLGTVENESYTIATASLGQIKIPAARVVGLVSGSKKDPRVRLLLADGQVVAGRMIGQVLQLTLAASSSPLKIPVSRIRQFGYRLSKDKPAAPVASGPIVILAGGYRLAWTECRQKLQLRTPGGAVDLPIKGVVKIQAIDPAARAYRVVFRNGSTLTGALLPAKLTLKLQLGPTFTCWRRNVRGFVMLARHVEPTGPATVQMRNGDRLFGKIADQTLTIRTEFGDVKVRAASLVSMVFDPKKTGQVKAKTWNGATISGRLVAPAVTVVVGPDGPAVKVTAAQITSITSSSALPPPEVLKKAEQLVAQLGAESYVDREAAAKALVAMGKGIVGVLKTHLASSDPEIRQRIQDILEQLGVKE